MFPPIIFKRLYLLYTEFFKEKKLHQINERFIIFPTSTIVLYKKRRKNRLFFVGFRLYRKKKQTKCSCYSLIMFFLLNQVLIYDVENQLNRHVIIGILLVILHQEKLRERIAQHC